MIVKERLASPFDHDNEDKARVGERNRGSGSNSGQQH
jgi:hypothetical protein